LYNLFLIFIGGAIGAALRHFTTYYLSYLFKYGFVATMIINILGSFLMGYLISIINTKILPEEIIKYFFIIGLVGSFTTFSLFSFEVVDLIIIKKYYIASVYIISSLFFCFLGLYLGISIAKI